MKSKTANFTRLIAGACCVIVIFGIATKARAQEKPDPNGMWTWSQSSGPGGTNNTITNTASTNSAPVLIKLSLRTDGGKLTGTLSTPTKDNQVRDVAIKDGKIKGDQISFSVNGEVKGLKILVKYNGKLDGDSINGKMDATVSLLWVFSASRSMDWEAKRMPDKK